MFDALDIGASGLLAQRTRMDVIAANMANASTTHDAAGCPNPSAEEVGTQHPALSTQHSNDQRRG